MMNTAAHIESQRDDYSNTTSWYLLGSTGHGPDGRAVRPSHRGVHAGRKGRFDPGSGVEDTTVGRGERRRCPPLLASRLRPRHSPAGSGITWAYLTPRSPFIPININAREETRGARRRYRAAGCLKRRCGSRGRVAPFIRAARRSTGGIPSLTLQRSAPFSREDSCQDRSATRRPPRSERTLAPLPRSWLLTLCPPAPRAPPPAWRQSAPTRPSARRGWGAQEPTANSGPNSYTGRREQKSEPMIICLGGREEEMHVGDPVQPQQGSPGPGRLRRDGAAAGRLTRTPMGDTTSGRTRRRRRHEHSSADPRAGQARQKRRPREPARPGTEGGSGSGPRRVQRNPPLRGAGGAPAVPSALHLLPLSHPR